MPCRSESRALWPVSASGRQQPAAPARLAGPTRVTPPRQTFGTQNADRPLGRRAVQCLPGLSLPLGFATSRGENVKTILATLRELRSDERGGVFVEYIVLLTIVGLGAIVGMALLRAALIEELVQLAQAITQLVLP